MCFSVLWFVQLIIEIAFIRQGHRIYQRIGQT